MEQPPGIAARIFGRGIFMMRKWVAVLVVLSLVGIVLLSGCVGQQSTTPTTTKPTGSSTQQTQVPVNLTVKPTKQVTIPVTGVFVKVSYIGGFSGTYGVNNVMIKHCEIPVINSMKSPMRREMFRQPSKKKMGQRSMISLLSSLKTGNR